MYYSDENSNMKTGVSATLVYNWDNKLREANTSDESIALRYDPAGNRIWKDSSVSGTRKYIVGIIGDLPVILLEIVGGLFRNPLLCPAQLWAPHF